MSSGSEARIGGGASEQQTSEIQYSPFRVRGSEGTVTLTGSWGYRRCRDFDPDNGHGQDFCAVRGGPGFLVGVVADGVSQSYYGDIAAREVGRFLLDHLWESREDPPAEAKLAAALSEIAPAIDDKVQAAKVAPLLEEVLAPIRQRVGSQTVFAAFVIDCREAQRDLVLYQCGDISSWIFGPDLAGRLQESHPKGRWASRGQSELRLTSHRIPGIVGILVHSDGLRREWAEELGSPEVSREVFSAEAEERAAIDDLAYIAVCCSRPAAREVGKLVQPQPGPEPAPQPPPQPGPEPLPTPAPPPIAPPQRPDRTRKKGSPDAVVPFRHRTWESRHLILALIAGLVLGLVVPFRPEIGFPVPVAPANPVNARSPPPPPSPPIAAAAPDLLDVELNRATSLSFKKAYPAFPPLKDLLEGDLMAYVELPSLPAGQLWVQSPSQSPFQIWPAGKRDVYLRVRFGPQEVASIVFEIRDAAGVVLARSAPKPLAGRDMEPDGPEHANSGFYDIALKLVRRN